MMLMSSGPVQLVLVCCIACFVSFSEIATCVFCSYFILSRTLLPVVEYFIVLVNSLLGFLFICGGMELVEFD